MAPVEQTSSHIVHHRMHRHRSVFSLISTTFSTSTRTWQVHTSTQSPQPLHLFWSITSILSFIPQCLDGSSIILDLIGCQRLLSHVPAMATFLGRFFDAVLCTPASQATSGAAKCGTIGTGESAFRQEG